MFVCFKHVPRPRYFLWEIPEQGFLDLRMKCDSYKNAGLQYNLLHEKYTYTYKNYRWSVKRFLIVVGIYYLVPIKLLYIIIQTNFVRKIRINFSFVKGEQIFSGICHKHTIDYYNIDLFFLMYKRNQSILIKTSTFVKFINMKLQTKVSIHVHVCNQRTRKQASNSGWVVRASNSGTKCPEIDPYYSTHGLVHARLSPQTVCGTGRAL